MKGASERPAVPNSCRWVFLLRWTSLRHSGHDGRPPSNVMRLFHRCAPFLSGLLFFSVFASSFCCQQIAFCMLHRSISPPVAASRALAMSDLRPPEHQVAGHRASGDKLGPLVDGAGLFYKPLQALDRGEQELAFYEAFSTHPAVPPRIRDAFFPRFHGTRLLPSPAGGEPHPHIVLNDVLEGLAAPSVTDIKIGACTWPPRAPEPYVAKCLAKDRGTTSILLGFRVSGVRVTGAAGGAVWRPERSELKGMDIPGVRRVLRRFVSSVGGLGATDDSALAAAVYGGEGGVLAQLRELKAWFEEQTLFHFYSASVLLCYDANLVAAAGGGAGGGVRVKLVDFAHVVESEGVIDHNFLGGLCSLIKFISDIVAEASETAAP